MNRIGLEIAGHRYDVACRPGQEGHFLALARVIEAKVDQASGAMGRMDATRQLLFAALLLADELGEAKARPPANDDLAEALDALAARIERLAED